MAIKVLSSDKARANWREVLETAVAGNDVVVERYGKPTVAVIAYQDFAELEEILQDIRDAREARIALAEWEKDPDSFLTWEEVKAELIADGLIDG